MYNYKMNFTFVSLFCVLSTSSTRIHSCGCIRVYKNNHKMGEAIFDIEMIIVENYGLNVYTFPNLSIESLVLSVHGSPSQIIRLG